MAAYIVRRTTNRRSTSLFFTLLLSFLLATGSFSSLQAGVNEWTSNGPYGEVITWVAISPNYEIDQTIFAGTLSSGIYKSTNAGASWVQVNSGLTSSFADTNINAIAVSSNYETDQTVFAGTNRGIFKSTNGGASWSEMNSGLTNLSANAVAISPNYQTDQTVFVGTWGGGVYKSTNGGASWTQINDSVIYTYIFAIAISPAYQIDQTIFIGTRGGGVYKSTNGGATWTQINIGLSDTYVFALGVSPNYQTDQTIFAGTWGGGIWSGGIYKSTNGGATWTQVYTGLSDTYIFALSVSPAFSSDQTIYAGIYFSGVAGVFRSTNSGASWTQLSNGLETAYVYSLAVVPNYQNDRTVFAGTNFGVFSYTPADNPLLAVIDSISPNPAVQGQSVTFSGHGIDSDGTVVAYNWRSSMDGQLSTSPAFSTSNLSVGTHVIYFKVQDNSGAWSPEATMLLTINQSTYGSPPLAIITMISPSPAVQGQNVTFSGHGIDSDGTVVAYNWRSSIDGQLSTSPAFSTSNLSVGTHVIYFKVQDNSGAWSPEASTFLEVNASSLPGLFSSNLVWDSGIGNWDGNASKLVSGDFNGDGKADIAVFYGYTLTHQTKAWVFDAGFNPPTVWWDSGPNNWDWEGTKLAVGDFNSDGKDDIVVFYGYFNERISRVWVFISNGTSFNQPTIWYDLPPNSWEWMATKIESGDVNGDGSADLVAFYGYFSQRQTRAWVFTNNGSMFNAPGIWWDSGPNNWDWIGTKLAAGDFNDDGRDDVIAFYGYFSPRQSRAWGFTSSGASFNSPTAWFDSGPNNWDWEGSQIESGDYDGNGRDDLAAFYGYFSTRETKIWIFISKPGGGLYAPAVWWGSGGPNTWDWFATKIVSGDFDGSGQSELGGFYYYGNAHSAIFLIK